jgi:hypothetical protein
VYSRAVEDCSGIGGRDGRLLGEAAVLAVYHDRGCLASLGMRLGSTARVGRDMTLADGPSGMRQEHSYGRGPEVARVDAYLDAHGLDDTVRQSVWESARRILAHGPLGASETDCATRRRPSAV